MNGYLSSFLSMSALDGDGLRSVFFMQGCPLRCRWCHNPETHGVGGGTVIDERFFAEKAARYKGYYGERGGITVSGGEPFLQSEFLKAAFRHVRTLGVNITVETCGNAFDEYTKGALEYVDFCYLDVKLTDEREYREYTGGSLDKTLDFLSLLNEMKIKTAVRHLIIPGLTDSEQNLRKLYELVNERYADVRIELLPFMKLCREKYEAMGIKFPMDGTEPATEQQCRELRKYLG